MTVSEFEMGGGDPRASCWPSAQAPKRPIAVTSIPARLEPWNTLGSRATNQVKAKWERWGCCMGRMSVYLDDGRA
jgi:hypothetical protein